MKKNWLFNKNVIITGASGGLGFSIAKTLVENYNCNVIGIARNEEKIKKSIDTILVNKKNFIYEIFDVSIEENWTNFYNKLIKNNFIPDILINNAGIMLKFDKFKNYTKEETDEIIKTNFYANIYSTRTMLPLLRKSKTPAIINVVSAAGLCPVVGESLYVATKHAMKGFTECLQLEEKDIYVAGIYPGFIQTDILSRQNHKNEKIISKMMMPIKKACNKIINGISHKKRRIVIGFDGKYMDLFTRLFPKATPKFIKKVLKISKLKMFEDVFIEEKNK